MTKFELVIPVSWGVVYFDGLKRVFEKQGREYAWARHIPDEHCSFEHWHIGATLHSSRTIDDVAGWFAGFQGIQKNSIEKIRKHWKTYLCYLLHKTDEAVKQGKTPPVEYGGTADFETALADYKTIGECDTLIEDILAGKMREFEFHSKPELVQAVIKKGWYNKVKQAFESYTNGALAKSANRSEERKQCWIFGKAGSGKTELAKWLCRSSGFRVEDIYITSSGNNPFDDYKGQPCVIVDDIDAETMSPKTMLKLADCFTGSAVKARYSNKVILAEMVVFTSTVAPQNWWKKLADDKVDGNVFQLLRRLNLGSWHIEENSINCAFYDGQGNAVVETTMKLPDEVADKVNNSTSQALQALNFLKGKFEVTSTNVRDGSQITMQIDPVTGEFSGLFADGKDGK